MLKKIIISNIVFTFALLGMAQSSEGAGMPQLDPQYWFSQIFWLILTFGTLFVILSKFILPKISNNLEIRKSQILENIEMAEKQRLESENKIKEYEKIILDSKNQPKNYLNEAKQKVVADINKKPVDMLGHVSSSYYSPNLKKSIALGFYGAIAPFDDSTVLRIKFMNEPDVIDGNYLALSVVWSVGSHKPQRY